MTAVAPRYETIGVGYARRRQPDPRIARQIHGHLGSPTAQPHVLNVGAGTGSYEPADRRVTAVEPAPTMIAQRSHTATREVVRAVGGALPFPAGTFDAATALLTVHHWPDIATGLAEVRRVTTGPVVVFTFDYDVHATQWLVGDYFPEAPRRPPRPRRDRRRLPPGREPRPVDAERPGRRDRALGPSGSA